MPMPFEKDAADDHQEIAQRIEIGQPLHRRAACWRSGKAKPESSIAGKKKRKVAHHRLLLRAG